MNCVTDTKPTEAQLTDMEFGMRVVKFVKSNAICIVKDGVTLAVGGGQTSRIWALENAIINNKDKDFNGAVLASDAFFPFSDCAEVAYKAGIGAIVQEELESTGGFSYALYARLRIGVGRIRHYQWGGYR